MFSLSIVNKRTPDIINNQKILSLGTLKLILAVKIIIEINIISLFDT